MTTRVKPDREHLTVLIFKDNLAARSFRVPLRWISSFGFLLALAAALTLVSVLSAGRFYSAAKKSVPGHVLELESDLKDLEGQNRSLESQVNDLENRMRKLVETGKSDKGSESLVFTDFSPKVKMADSGLYPAITITKKSATQIGNVINLNFVLEYNRKDGGKQEGRIVLIARGSRSILTYPVKTISENEKNLIDHTQGEYFSVSRIRPVDAALYASNADGRFSSADILIFDNEDTLIIKDKIRVKQEQAPPPAPRPAPKKQSAKPQSSAVETALPAPAATSNATLPTDEAQENNP